MEIPEFKNPFLLNGSNGIKQNFKNIPKRVTVETVDNKLKAKVDLSNMLGINK